MPTVPMLPQGGSISSSGVPTDPMNFLIAAADMHKNGQLPSQAATPQRSMPKGQSMNLPVTSHRAKKNIKVIK